MNLFESARQWVLGNAKYYQGDNQLKLVLLVCVPCFTITIVALCLADISLYLIAFIIIILTLLCSYVVVASQLNSDYQIRTLSNLIESMIDGDYTLRGRLQTNQAFQELLNLINELADTLSKHKIEAKESRLLLERIMEQMDAIVLATDETGLVVMANASAKKLVLGKVNNIENTLLSSTLIGEEIENATSGIVDFSHTQLTGEHFLLKEAFLSEGKKHQLYMLTNAERLLMEKERKAWQSLLRVLSHELNNSLTPIVAISQTMQSKLQKLADEKQQTSLLDGIGIINERAGSLSEFIASYSQLAHLPKPNISTLAFKTMLDNLAALFPMCRVITDIDATLKISADKNQFEQVMINIFKNAVEAMAQQSEKIIHVSARQEGAWQHITIEDQGAGIANLDNVFVPFYTTKNQGSGIGLTLCRQIMFNHNGLIKLKNVEVDNQGLDNQGIENQGVAVTLSLPLNDSVNFS
ncbi:ATP-binding protein [Colwellia sp. 1_MG-2023]|uniref:sensor histidine kinase n=1 Tax=Colwellia sp. 1_MG-2023 TaxID=3062649 RepID=UPI0026E182A3|nr:ATP-binding protein [Colwellia sp. 1_MG-2023]MDO6444842.1 ATP-binding protein [Colwellia sp. 1_MG-2023]